MNIGERVGDYEIVEVLGAGGMGQVYKVRNVLSERIEAMKVLLPNMGADPELADRFLREIKVQAALDHPNIARLHTAQQAGNQLCMIMEFVEGSSLEELLQHGPIALRDCVSYVSQVLDALAYAHARGVVHRDIKPGNIMRTPSGAVKLMDFGIARMKADRRLTQTGHTVGSLYYMSPEQIQGGEPDPRSDLYSLGVTMYEMVTGRKPFQGDSDYSIMAAHLQQTPAAPIEVVPGVPPDLSDIILMAITKDREARFQTAEAFQHALQNAAGAPAPPPGVGQGFAPGTPTRIIGAPPPPVPPPVYAAAAPPPMPPPVYAAAAPPPMPLRPAPAVKSGSRRGLYMALGSIATLAVLAFAVIEVPKLRNTRAQESKQETTQPSPPAASPEPAAAAPAADTHPAAEAAPPEAAPPTSVSTPAPAAAASAKPQTAPSNRAKVLLAPQQQQQPQGAPAQQATPGAVQSSPSPQPPAPAVKQTAPAQTAPAVAQSPPQQTQAPPQQKAASSPQANPQLNELRQQYNELAIRASSAKNGLRSMQQQMARQGLNLRGDMLEAESRMDYQMKEAMDYIRTGDADQARASLQMAQRAAETIEKFLGR